ncbi:MAG: permease, partial [Candidatus Omnitrophica bacterium]|nr:permease [Candidatus Omnitrophota bacterium]
MVLWWILIGTGLASLAGAYIPSTVFNNYMGPTLLGLLVTLLVATVIEVCSEGSAPMAFEIFRQTGALGNSFVFLMAGVVTDYTEIGLLWHNLGRRVAIWMVLVSVPQVIILGFIANLIFK